MDMEAYDESIMDTTQNNEELLQMVQTEREIMDTLRSRLKRPMVMMTSWDMIHYYVPAERV